MSYVTTRDKTELYVKTWGEGRPVVLIHGWPLSSMSWDPVACALAESGYKVIAYDRRGFGRSDQPWSGYDYNTLTDDLADVMKATGATKDVTLVGFSMGGGEVARYMTNYKGAGVTRAALISSIVPYMLKTDNNPDGVPEDKLQAIADGIKEDRPKFFRSFLKDFFGIGVVSHPVSDETVDMAWGLCMQAGLRPTLECANAFGHTDFRSDLKSFTVPTLIVHGTADKTVPIDATARKAAEGIKDSYLIEYDGAPHGVFASDTERLIADLKAFLIGDTKVELPVIRRAV